MANSAIIPTGFDVKVHEDGEMIKLIFDDDQSHSSEVILGRSNIPLLISELQKFAPAPRTEMRPEDIALGKVLALRGVKVGPGQDGGVRLVLSIEMDENSGIDLPMNLTAQERDGLVSQLLAFVRKS